MFCRKGKLGESWYSDFWYEGKRYKKAWGRVPKTIAKQKEILYETQRKRWNELLEEIKLIIPKEVRLTKLTDRENEVIFTGEATSQEGVFNFVRSLRESPYFTEVKLHTAKDKETQGEVWVDFNIRCQLDFQEDK